jgi:hypothetical protein
LLLVEETDLAWFGGVYPFAESTLSAVEGLRAGSERVEGNADEVGDFDTGSLWL